MKTELKNRTSFFDQPYSRASLRDHQRWKKYRDQRESPFAAAARSFLGCSDAQISSLASAHTVIDVPQINLTIEHCLSDWKLVRLRGERSADCRPWQPTSYRCEVAPDVFRSVVSHGTWFFEAPDGSRRILSLEMKYGASSYYEFQIIYPIGDELAAREEFDRISRWIADHHYLTGQAINPNATLLPAAKPLTWDDVHLNEPARHTIMDNVRQFFDLRAAMTRNGAPLRRGLLLYGPPGNGKTLVGKVIRATEKATFMYATAADAENACMLRGAFALARRFKPTILFLEDLDMFASDRRGSFDCHALGEILGQLDGMQDNDGIMVIATTNDLESIEPALRDRPSRFDVVVEIGSPDASARHKIIERCLAKTKRLSEELFQEAIRRTDGFSGAQVQEAAWRIIQQAIMAGSVDPAGLAQPMREHIEAALPHRQSRGRIGFNL